MTFLGVTDLTFRYRGRKRAALRNVSFELERGETLLVLGPSGCGKSTLALCLNGAIPHFVEGELSGQVRIDARDTRSAPMAQLAQTVGIVFQDPESQFCMLTVEEEVAFGLENLAVPRADMDARIAEALDWVGLADRRQEQIERLSGGQKQRLALACVLAQKPDVLVFDEPTAQLDPVGAAEVVDLLRRLRAEGRHSLVIVEHRLDDLMSLVDQTLVLNHSGEVVTSGPPREVMHRWSGWLAEAGVWVPQVSELATALEERGLEIEPFPLTIDEAVQALRRVRWQPARPEARTSATPEPMFEVDRLSYRYPGTERAALDEVTLTLRTGELTAIVGANGSGKTTLARLLVGIVKSPPGRIRRHGAGQVGYVFQYPEHQFVGRSVVDDVAFGLRRAGVREPRATQRAQAMLDELELGALAEAHPFTLSHGEQRRLSVAAMLVLNQPALFLDEPTFGQDRRNSDLVLDKLAALSTAGRCIVAITHDMRLVAERAQRAIALADGEVVFDGLPSRLFEDEAALHRARLRPPPLVEVAQRLGLARPLAVGWS